MLEKSSLKDDSGMLTRSYNPVWLFTDLNGNVLDDSFYMFTLENTLPYLPQTLSIDENGTSASNPVQFLANGTLPVNLYWDDTKIYRIEIRQGNTQADPLILEINNYVPLGTETPVPPADAATMTDNQITNPQFSILNFTGTLTLSAAGTYSIAPGWDIITTGSGSVLLTQATYTGDEFTPDNATNASYGLRIVNNGFTTVTLRQRFNHNGALWTGATGAEDLGPGVAINFTASATINIDLDIQLNFSDSTSISNIIPIPNTINQDFPLSFIIPVSTSSVTPDVAYTDLDFVISNSCTVEITSVQLIGQDVVQDVTYAQTTLERQEDQTFHYYNPQLQYKPLPSYLIGWDFAFNPCQELGKTPAAIATGASGSAYMADQLIVFQTVNSAISAAFTNVGVTFSAASNTSFAIVQYLDAATAVELLNQRLAFQLKGNISAGSAVSGTINLYWTTNVSLPDITSPAFDSVVTSITAGVPSVVAGWTAVARNNGSATFSMTTSSQTLSFNGWDSRLIANINNATFFAVVIAFDTMASSQTMTLNYASLVGGDIATRPAPLTAAQTLEALQTYYEKSYNPAVLPGTASATGAVFIGQSARNVAGTNAAYAFCSPASITYNAVKRTTPNLKYYSIAGTLNDVSAYLYYPLTGTAAFTISGPTDKVVASFWDATPAQTGFSLAPNTATPLIQVANSNTNDTATCSAGIRIHFVADARLGVV